MSPGLLLLAATVVVFLAFSLPPYVTGGTRVPPTFALHYPLLVGHVLLGGVAMVCALAQLWPGLRRRARVHRRIGRVYVATALPAALAALVLGALTPFGPILAVSNVVLALLWWWFTAAGWRAGRRRDFGAHRRHMLRSAVLALSIITNRVWTPVLFVVSEPLQHNVLQLSDEHRLWLVAGLGGWLGWTLPLLGVQWWLHRRTGRATSAIPRPVCAPPV